MRYRLLILVASAFLCPDLAASEIRSVATDDLFEVQQCQIDQIAPGTTIFRPHESNLVFHLSRCQLEKVTILGGHINVVRPHIDGRMVGIAKERPFDIDRNGVDAFTSNAKEQLFKAVGGIHHDIMKTKGGTYIAIGREFYHPWDDTIGKWQPRLHNLTLIDKVKQLFKFGTTKMVSDDIIVEFDGSGELLWKWSVNEHLLGSRTAAIELSRYKENWMHTNSVDEFSNGDVLISARNINQVIRISRPSGKIIWRWGNGELGLQHHATIQNDGSILIYDNGDHRRTTGWVRISEDGKLIERGDFDFFATHYGSIQLLPNGNFLTVNGPEGRVIEFASDGKTRLAVYQLIYRAYIPWMRRFRSDIYRAYYMP